MSRFLRRGLPARLFAFRISLWQSAAVSGGIFRCGNEKIRRFTTYWQGLVYNYRKIRYNYYKLVHGENAMESWTLSQKEPYMIKRLWEALLASHSHFLLMFSLFIFDFAFPCKCCCLGWSGFRRFLRFTSTAAAQQKRRTKQQHRETSKLHVIICLFLNFCL